MSSRSDRSAGCTCAVPPSSPTSFATSSSFSRVRETRRTVPPGPPGSLPPLPHLPRRGEDEEAVPPRLADPQRQLAPDPARGSGHQDQLVLDRLRQAPLAEQVGVEVALPVVPQLRRVCVE